MVLNNILIFKCTCSEKKREGTEEQSGEQWQKRSIFLKIETGILLSMQKFKKIFLQKGIADSRVRTQKEPSNGMRRLMCRLREYDWKKNSGNINLLTAILDEREEKLFSVLFISWVSIRAKYLKNVQSYSLPFIFLDL